MKHPKAIGLTQIGVGMRITHYACSVCGMVHGKADPGGYSKSAAERCCSTVCDICGGEKPIRGYCSPCARDREATREALNFASAVKVHAADHAGPVYCPTADRFWSDAGEAIEWHQGTAPKEALPGYVWACSTRTLELDADAIVDGALDSMDEGAEAEAVDELRAFLVGWNAKQTRESWEPDYDIAVLLGTASPPAVVNASSETRVPVRVPVPPHEDFS